MKSCKNTYKKILEQRYLNFFTETDLGKIFFKNLIPFEAEGEEPDFLYKNILTNEIIGIEIVNIIIKSEKQQSTAKLNRIVKNVCSKLFDYTSTRYFVFLGCNDGNYEKINIKVSDYVEKIFNIIVNDKQLALNATQIVKFKLNDGNILHLSYGIKNEGNYNFYGVPDGGIVNQNPFELLQTIINEKNIKYLKYKQKCNKCILLVVSDNMMGQSSFIDFDEKINTHVFNSCFDKVFLYEFGGKIHSNSTLLKIENKK